MSFYELEAEDLRRFYFHFRSADDFETLPPFHGAVEFHFVEEGEQTALPATKNFCKKERRSTIK